MGFHLLYGLEIVFRGNFLDGLLGGSTLILCTLNSTNAILFDNIVRIGFEVLFLFYELVAGSSTHPQRPLQLWRELETGGHLSPTMSQCKCTEP